MRILTFTNLYPNSRQPRHGIFVEQRLKHLLANGLPEAKVVAPVPWFPFRGRRFGAWGEFAAIPRQETRDGVEVFYPRYPVIPKVGMSVAPLLMAHAVKPSIERLIADGYDFDVIDAHYFYPDGVAAVMLGRWLQKPVVISARGTDINMLPDFAIPRRWIRWAAAECAAIITVSRALKDRLCDLGASEGKITVLRNGVDLALFRPLDRQDTRDQLGVTRTLLLSVGNLIETKGHDLAIRALARIPDADLIVIGRGPSARSLRVLASAVGVADRVRFIDNLPQAELVRYYNAAEALLLVSVSEGMPNVILEAIACGTPVVATATGGAMEIVSCPEAGELMHERQPSALVDALSRLRRRVPDPAATRRHAEKFGWADVVRDQLALYATVAGES
jgi:glycosyltransferase involved in cell wall biosynthesis